MPVTVANQKNLLSSDIFSMSHIPQTQPNVPWNIHLRNNIPYLPNLTLNSPASWFYLSISSLFSSLSHSLFSLLPPYLLPLVPMSQLHLSPILSSLSLISPYFNPTLLPHLSSPFSSLFSSPFSSHFLTLSSMSLFSLFLTPLYSSFPLSSFNPFSPMFPPVLKHPYIYTSPISLPTINPNFLPITATSQLILNLPLHKFVFSTPTFLSPSLSLFSQHHHA